MRTADLMAQRVWGFPLGLRDNEGFMEWARESLVESRVILADNVARYLSDQNLGVSLEGYASLAPPWSSFWVEYGSSSGRQRRGVLVFDASERGQGEPTEGLLPDDGRHIEELIRGARAHAESADVRWVLLLILFVEQDRKVWGPAGLLALALDVGGQVVGNRWSVSPVLAAKAAIDQVIEGDSEPRSASDWEWNPPTEEEMMAMSRGQLTEVLGKLRDKEESLDDYIESLEGRVGELEDAQTAAELLIELGADEKSNWLIRALAPAMQSIAFLHCRNVELEVVDPPQKLQRARARRGKALLLRYHTLRVEVPRRQSDGAGSGESVKRSLHIVAGHFAHYGACCPNHETHGLLFGCLSGVYWVPSHARGDIEQGVVHTDFDLVTEKVGA